MDGMMSVVVPALNGLAPAQAESDATLLRLWLHGRTPSTTAAYTREAAAFLAYVGKPLAHVRLGELQEYADTLLHLAPGSRNTKLAAIKSLFSFAYRLGSIPFNTAAALRLPPVRQQLAARIMSEVDVHRMLALETKARNSALLFLLYGAGLRATEAAELRWRDLHARDDAGQVTVFGKGGKTRSVLLPTRVWAQLVSLRGEAGLEAPVFVSSRGGGCLDRSAVHRIVKVAAARAGLSVDVSAHWLRHAHVSHALDRGAPAHLVQQTVGHASLVTTSRYAHARPHDSSARYLGL